MPSYALIAEADAACAEQYRGLVAAEGVQLVVTRDGAAARAVLEERGAPGWPAQLTLVLDAAFGLYARGASDYRP